MTSTIYRNTALLASVLLLVSTGALAANKTYQVTGPVLEMTDSTITVQKGSEKWVLKKDATTASKGEVKVGSKVTIEYSMTATSIEAKEAKSPKKKK